MGDERVDDAQVAIVAGQAHLASAQVGAMLASALPSPYGGATFEGHHTAVGTPLFSVVAARGTDDDDDEADVEDAAALATLAGLGGAAAAAYPNDPKLVQAIVAQQVRVVGVATAVVDAGTFATDGISPAIGGVVTATLGSDGAGSPPYIVPGQLVRGVVPRPAGSDNAYGLSNAADKTARLQLVPHTGESTAAAFVAHLHAMTVPGNDTWANVHDARSRNASALNTALHNYVTSALATAALAAPLLGTRALEGVFELDDDGDFDESLADPSTRIAVALGVIPDRSGTLNPRASANLRARVLARVLYSGANAASEVGYERNTNRRLARCDDGTTQAPADTSLGDMLTVQLNHTTAAVAAFSDFAYADSSNVVGRALSATSQTTKRPRFTLAVRLGAQ